MTDLLTALGLVGTAVSILVAARVYRRQMNAQLFLEYTKRYEELANRWPQAMQAARVADAEDLPPPSEELRLGALRYLALCSEEYYLWKRRYVSADFWNIWQVEIERCLRSPLYRREWPGLAEEFLSHEEFAQFVRRVQAE
jgi:hypothetical protein